VRLVSAPDLTSLEKRAGQPSKKQARPKDRALGRVATQYSEESRKNNDADAMFSQL
jgi:hypothetical protein